MLLVASPRRLNDANALYDSDTASPPPSGIASPPLESGPSDVAGTGHLLNAVIDKDEELGNLSREEDAAAAAEKGEVRCNGSSSQGGEARGQGKRLPGGDGRGSCIVVAGRAAACRGMRLGKVAMAA